MANKSVIVNVDLRPYFSFLGQFGQTILSHCSTSTFGVPVNRSQSIQRYEQFCFQRTHRSGGERRRPWQIPRNETGSIPYCQQSTINNLRSFQNGIYFLLFNDQQSSFLSNTLNPYYNLFDTSGTGKRYHKTKGRNSACSNMRPPFENTDACHNGHSENSLNDDISPNTDEAIGSRLENRDIYHDNRRLLKHRAKNCECHICYREIHKLPPAETHDEYVSTIKTKIIDREIKRAKKKAKRDVKSGKQARIQNFFPSVWNTHPDHKSVVSSKNWGLDSTHGRQEGILDDGLFITSTHPIRLFAFLLFYWDYWLWLRITKIATILHQHLFLT